MATVTEMRVLATDATWQFRVWYQVLKAAIAVMAEDVGTTNHANRYAFAKLVLSDAILPGTYAIAVLTNATIAADADPAATIDGTIEFVVNSMYDAFANSAA